jgi:hypothetical protein
LTGEELISEIEGYESVLSGILSRFTKGRNAIYIGEGDEARLRQVVGEVIDLFNDTLGRNNYSAQIAAAFNEGVSNFYGSPSYHSVETIIAIVRTAITRLKKNPNLLHHRNPVPAEATMKVFVSHSTIDKLIAKAFVELLRAALRLSAKDIRCTSVDGYKLPAGIDSNEQLRQEVFEAQAFIALLSPDSIKSIYVMFELGARWGSKHYLAPVMVAGLTPSALKPPLSTTHAATGTSTSDLHQLIDKISEVLNIAPESPAGYSTQLAAFIDAAKVSRHENDPSPAIEAGSLEDLSAGPLPSAATSRSQPDLYNRRLDIYKRTLAFFQIVHYFDPSKAIKEERSEYNSLEKDFIRAHRESQFLFGDKSKVFELMEQFRQKANRMVTHRELRETMLSSDTQEGRLKAYAEYSDDAEWVNTKFIRLFEEAMKPDLDFDKSG